MAQPRKWAKSLLKMLITLAVTVALCELTIPHLGFFWHLTHNESVVVGGHAFQVPPRYFATHDEGKVLLSRFSFKIPFWPDHSPISGSYATLNLIGINPRPNGRNFGKDADYARLQDFLTHQAAAEGLVPQSTRDLRTRTGIATCYEFGNHQVAEVTCFIDKSPVLITFYGEPRYLDDVYALVTSAREVW